MIRLWINITTHARDDDFAYKAKDSKRADHRKEVADRKKQEKEDRLKELNIARQAKKEEFVEKIDVLLKIAGKKKNKENDKIVDKLYHELDKDDFDETNFEQLMNSIFDKTFYKGDTIEDDENKLIEDGIIGEEVNEVMKEVDDEIDNMLPRKASNNQINFNKAENDIEETNDEQWWYCDICKSVIKQGKIRYDCTKCEDLTYCKSCFKTQEHEHIMKKEKVPLTCIVRLYNISY